MTTEMSFEGDSRISKVEHIRQGSLFKQVQSLFKYDYDNDNNKTRMKTFRRALPINEQLDYTYDKKDQLLTATNPLKDLADEIFTYDITGNRLRTQVQSQDSIYNGNNQLTEDEAYIYAYDEKGNLTEKKHKVDETVTRYDWDTENQLTRVTKHEMETALPSETITYAYDALGRRIEKRIMDEKGNETSKKYVYDNEDILMEFNGEGLFQKFYVHGLGIDNPLAMLKDNEETRNDTEDLKAYYYHKDGMNSITSLTDESGDEVEKYIYNAFGKMTVFDERDNKLEQSKLDNPYSFTGREHDSETGLHYHRARYYNPELARWISEDPIEFNSGDMNLYRYVFNNPLIYTDPSGKVCYFYVRAGRLRCTKAKINIGGVYAGAPGYKNKPEFEHLKDKGPIPRGTYTIKSYSAKNKKFKFRLKPNSATRKKIEEYGREPDTFLIHGQSDQNPGNDSQGCIVVKNNKYRLKL